jgi:PIN domain nuclease of toxin-antitoxin system
VRNLESLAAVNKIGGWLKVLMKIFIKTFDICQELNLTEGPTNYIPLVREDRLDSSCITFHQILSVRYLPSVHRNPPNGIVISRVMC